MPKCFQAARGRSAIATLLSGFVLLALLAGTAFAAYPPQVKPLTPKATAIQPSMPQAGIVFTNTHAYGYGADPAAVVIRVDVYDNFFGDFTKYHWIYTVTNHSYNPAPGLSNGFSGFETTLPAAVPDIGNITAPDGIGPWIINTYSGLPVEWDLPNPVDVVGGGTMPGQTEVYGFTTLPRLIIQSTGWFHTWAFGGQTDIVNYPPGDGIEVPDVISDPGQEFCCYMDAAGAFQCKAVPTGQCAALAGTIVATCNNCPPVTPTHKSTWGKVKTSYR